MHVLGVLVPSRATEHSFSRAKAIQRKSRPTRSSTKNHIFGSNALRMPKNKKKEPERETGPGNEYDEYHKSYERYEYYECRVNIHCEHHGTFDKTVSSLTLSCFAVSRLVLSLSPSRPVSFCLVSPRVALTWFALPCLISSHLILSCLALLCLALPRLVSSCRVLFRPVSPSLLLLCLALPCFALHCLALPCLALLWLALPHLVLSRLVSSFVLSGLVWSCPVLS